MSSEKLLGVVTGACRCSAVPFPSTRHKLTIILSDAFVIQIILLISLILSCFGGDSALLCM